MSSKFAKDSKIKFFSANGYEYIGLPYMPAALPYDLVDRSDGASAVLHFFLAKSKIKTGRQLLSILYIIKRLLSVRTTPLTFRRLTSTIVDVPTANLQNYILYIYSTNIGTEYFKHGVYSPLFFSL